MINNKKEVIRNLKSEAQEISYRIQDRTDMFIERVRNGEATEEEIADYICKLQDLSLEVSNRL